MNNPMYNTLILIRPLDYYFFGGETTFGNGTGQNYFAKSNPFPQQTTVLGLLRFLGYNKIPIGDSFDPQLHQQQNFGYIKFLSPIFLMDDSAKAYLPGALGDPDGKPYNIRSAQGNVKTWVRIKENEEEAQSSRWRSMFEALNYKEKDGWSQQLLSTATKTTQSFEDVFVKTVKIGITKGKKGEPRKDAFYKQEIYKLKKGWSFAVLADLGDEWTQLPSSFITPFGAEKALFQVTFQAKNESFDQLFPKSLWKHSFDQSLEAFVLLSDAFVADSFRKDCDFAITATRDFRNIRTPNSVRNFGPLHQHNAAGTPPPSSLYKSGKYNLLSRGSMLYGKAARIEALLKQAAFSQIGYNHFYQL